MASTLKKLKRESKNAWKGFTDVEIWVREATSNDSKGPPRDLMRRIANASHNPVDYQLMFRILWKRLADFPHIRHVTKSLLMIDFLLQHGPDRFLDDCRERIDIFRRLSDYRYFLDGQDVGNEVRRKAENMLQLLGDPERLQQRRKVSQQMRDKIKGFGYQNAHKHLSEKSSSFRSSDPLAPKSSKSMSDEEESMTSSSESKVEETLPRRKPQAKKIKVKPKSKSKTRPKKSKSAKKIGTLDDDDSLFQEGSTYSLSNQTNQIVDFEDDDFFDTMNAETGQKSTRAPQQQQQQQLQDFDQIPQVSRQISKPLFEPDFVSDHSTVVNKSASPAWMVLDKGFEQELLASQAPKSEKEEALFDLFSDGVLHAPKQNQVQPVEDDFNPFDEDDDEGEDHEVSIDTLAVQLADVTNLHETHSDRIHRKQMEKRKLKYKKGKTLKEKSTRNLDVNDPFGKLVLGEVNSGYANLQSQSSALVTYDQFGRAYYTDPAANGQNQLFWN